MRIISSSSLSTARFGEGRRRVRTEDWWWEDGGSLGCGRWVAIPLTTLKRLKVSSPSLPQFPPSKLDPLSISSDDHLPIFFIFLTSLSIQSKEERFVKSSIQRTCVWQRDGREKKGIEKESFRYMEGFEDQVITIWLEQGGKLKASYTKERWEGKSCKRRRGREGVLDVEELLFWSV